MLNPKKNPTQEIFENSRFVVEVVKHPFPDTFAISDSGGSLCVRRIDHDAGWRQNLLIEVRDKTTGRSRKVAVGPSNQSFKMVEVPIWNSYGSKNPSPKMALILAGEAFRYGRVGRSRDVPESFELQKKASISHMLFVDHIKKERGLDCDIMIGSYDTKYEKELLGWYGNRLISSSFRNNLVGLEALVRDAIFEIEFDDYDSLLISRVDIEFKDYLKHIFDPSWERIMFPSACWEFMGYMERGTNWIPRISDTMEFVPKRLFSHVRKSFHLCHEAWMKYRRGGLKDSDLGLMLDTYHDSDSAKDYNPLYRMASRRDSRQFHSPNLKIGEDLAPKKHYGPITFPDWQQSITDPYEDEYVLISPKYDVHVREESFIIRVDHESRQITVTRKDKDEGWSGNLVLMVSFKKSAEDKLLVVGSSDKPHKSVPLDQRLDFLEDENFVYSIKDHKYPDSFVLTKKSEKEIIVERVDSTGAWRHPHSIRIVEKSTGAVDFLPIGPSESSSKVISVDSKLFSAHPQHKKRVKVALCIRGAVSKKKGSAELQGQIYEEGSYVNYKAAANSVFRHIVEPNKSMDIDVFLHSWSVDLKSELESLYSPKSSLFENNEMYADEIQARCACPSDFSGVSHALSIKRVIQLKEEYERSNSIRYDLVVLYRPDVLLWSDMPLYNYDVGEGVFVNAHPGGNGDFHFVMSSDDTRIFKGLYDSPLLGNRCRTHFWIKKYIEKSMGRRVIADGIVPGRHQEVLRPKKMNEGPISKYRIGREFLFGYGLTAEDLS